MTATNATHTDQTLAACLIVKDEQRHLAACLDTLTMLVDEIVVVDTGSTDDTVAIAESYGARVVHTAWTGDFSAARNVGLAEVRSDWVLSVDADERIVAEAATLKPMLALATAPLLALEITHALPESRSYRMWSGKLFRPSLRWTGAVHERPVNADGTEPDQRRVPAHVLRVDHFGYVDRAVNEAKAARNAEIAQAELQRVRSAGNDFEEETRLLLQVARSLNGSGETERLAEAVAALEVVDRSRLSQSICLQIDDFRIKTYLGAGAVARVLHLVRELRTTGANPAYCDWLEGKCLLALGEAERAHELLSGLTEVIDLVGGTIDPAALAADQRRAANGETYGTYDAAAAIAAPAAVAGVNALPDEATALLNLARSLAGAGRRQEAFDTLVELRDVAAPGSLAGLQGSDLMAQLLLEASEFDMALGLVEEMRQQDAPQPYCDWLAGQAWAQLGEFAEAHFLLEPLTDVFDTGGRLLDGDVVAEMRHAAAQLVGAVS